MLGSKKKEEAFPVNEALLNVITPMGLEIKRNSLVIGENLGKVYGAVRYPQKVDMGWLSKITNIPSTIVSVGITPIDNGALISAISKSIVQQRGAADSAKDPLTRQRAEKAAEDGEKIMQRIDQEGETVAMMSLTVMPIAQDEANFTKVCRRVESAFNIQKCKVRTLANLQKEGFQSISPTYPANSTVGSIVSRIIPMSTFVGGFPFASSGYNDGRGYYFAKDSNGGLVILDTWERGNDRTNSSFVIMGVAGIGKSTVVKHIMLSEYMKGTKILCIDPESEYKDTVVAAAITSRKAKNSLPTHILLENVPGLAPTSLLLLEQLRTIDRKRLRGYIGRISKEKMLEVDVALAISIGIGYPSKRRTHNV